MMALALATLLAQQDGFHLNGGEVRFRSVELRPGLLRASDLDMNVGDALEIRSDGLTPDFSSRIEFDETERLDAFSLGVMFDFNLFRLAVDGFYGDWEGKGILSFGQAGGPATTQVVDLEGDAWGAHFSVEWPALRYESASVAATLGPVLGANWFHQEFEDPAASPLPFDDEHVNALVGSIGPRFGLSLRFDRLELSAEIELSYLFGQYAGLQERAALGLGLRF